MEEDDEESMDILVDSGVSNEVPTSLEVPGVLHLIFLYSSIEMIMNYREVSRTFRAVATTDLLWKAVVQERNIGYFNESSDEYRNSQIFMMPFYRVDETENIYETIMQGLKAQHEYPLVLERIRRRQKMMFWLLVFLSFLFSPCCPLMTSLLHGCLAIRQLENNFDEIDKERAKRVGRRAYGHGKSEYLDIGSCLVFASTSSDITFSSIINTFFCCCCGPFAGILCGLISSFVIVGRHFLFKKERYAEHYGWERDCLFYHTSPSLMVAVYLFLGILTCLASMFCIAQVMSILNCHTITKNLFKDGERPLWSVSCVLKWVLFSYCMFWIWDGEYALE